MGTTTTSVIEAWQIAGRELGIEVVAPFSFEIDGRIHECLVWLPHFGREKGVVLVGMGPPDFRTDKTLRADAKHAGYQWSAIDWRTYAAYEREKFIDALLDWGFTGPRERRPPWLDGAAAVEAAMRQAAEHASQQLAVDEGLLVEHTILGQDVKVLPMGVRTLTVRITLQDGSRRCFEYRCDTSGLGQLWPVECL